MYVQKCDNSVQNFILRIKSQWQSHLATRPRFLAQDKAEALGAKAKASVFKAKPKNFGLKAIPV